MDIEVRKFVEHIIEMIDSGSTCSEILEEVNKQPKKIRDLFEGAPMLTLKSNKDKILKDQLTQIKIGTDLHNLPVNVLNEFDFFRAFLTKFTNPKKY